MATDALTRREGDQQPRRKGHLAAPQQHLRAKATHQLLHPYNHSIRAVIFITLITLTRSFYVPFSAEIPADVPKPSPQSSRGRKGMSLKT